MAIRVGNGGNTLLLRTANLPAFQSGYISMTGWFYFDSHGAQGRVFGLRDAATGTKISFDDDISNSIGIQLNHIPSGSILGTRSDTQVGTGTWFFCGWAWQGGSAGVANSFFGIAASGASAWDYTSTVSSVVYGEAYDQFGFADHPSGGLSFNGRLASWKVWSHGSDSAAKLSSSQLFAERLYRNPQVTTNKLYVYKMLAAASAGTDTSGSGYNLTASGTATITDATDPTDILGDDPVTSDPYCYITSALS